MALLTGLRFDFRHSLCWLGIEPSDDEDRFAGNKVTVSVHLHVVIGIEGRKNWGQYTHGMAGGCDGCIWPRGETSLSLDPENDINYVIRKIFNKASLYLAPPIRDATCQQPSSCYLITLKSHLVYIASCSYNRKL